MLRRLFPYIKPSGIQPIRHLYSSKKGFDRDVMTQIQQPIDLRISAIKKWYQNLQHKHLKLDQRYIPERHQVLGPDLATAHFLIKRGGAVKLVGDDKWVTLTKDNKIPLPNKYRKGIHLEAIDASGMNIMYHSLENFIMLNHLKYLNLSDCKYIDDWCLDRLQMFKRSLQVLDISNCSGITEHGLSALFKLSKLTRLRAHKMSGIKNPELSMLMIEEMLPGCLVDTDVDYTDRDALERVELPESLQPLLGGVGLEDLEGLPGNVILEDGVVHRLNTVKEEEDGEWYEVEVDEYGNEKDSDIAR